jgi:hypothetical protein
MSRASVAGALTVLAAVAAGTAAQPAAAQPAADAPVLAFDGVWARIGEGMSPPPAYNAEYAARNQVMVDAIKAHHPMTDPSALCMPGGMPRLMAPALPFEMAVTPGRVFMMFEWNNETRRIYTDGRPQQTDPDPTFEGHSVGKWDHGQLLVDTVGFRPDTLFVLNQGIHSDALHITERMWLDSTDHLVDEITTNDPKAFVKPWVVTRVYERHPNWEIQEFVCSENNRNPQQNGTEGIELIPNR